MDAKQDRNNALKQHQLIMAEYSTVRKALSKREQFFFDKAMTLLEEIAEEESPSERVLVLSSAVMAGVCASKMSRREYVMLAMGIGSAVLKTQIVGGSDGRRDSD